VSWLSQEEILLRKVPLRRRECRWIA
jgi:hypothetical protein